MAKIHDEGKDRLLDILFGDQAVDAKYYIGLYKNVTALDDDATMADITEASGYGYVRKALNRGSWTATTGSVSYTLQTFLANGGAWGDVMGYFITTTATGIAGKLIASEHSSTAMAVTDGKGVKVIPTFTIL